jgi:hypothetical protein
MIVSTWSVTPGVGPFGIVRRTSVDPVVAGKTIRDRVLALMADGQPRTRADLAVAIGTTGPTISQTLVRLQAERRVEKFGNCHWRRTR